MRTGTADEKNMHGPFLKMPRPFWLKIVFLDAIDTFMGNRYTSIQVTKNMLSIGQHVVRI